MSTTPFIQPDFGESFAERFLRAVPAERPPGSPGRRAPARRRRRRRGVRRRRPSRGKRFARATCVVLTLALGVASVAGVYLYHRLSGNLHASALHGAVNGAPDPVETPGVMNILLIGTDSRKGLGSAYGDDGNVVGNADVEMLVHISADHSNATVTSIPRDLMVDIPACRSPSGRTVAGGHGTINASYAGGPGCTVDAVQQLTGITVNHFVAINFTGVIAMTNDIGGVPVCVNAPVNDPYSHLSLTKGINVVQGASALALLRSRHGFGDGSDLYRTRVQHMYLSSLIRKVASSTTLTSPVTMYSLAVDATSAMTVDPGLDSVGRLVSLGRMLSRIPADRVTFLTLPTLPDPADRDHVVPNPFEDALLYHLITSDQPLTTRQGARVTAVPNPALATGTGAPSQAPATRAANAGAATPLPGAGPWQFPVPGGVARPGQVGISGQVAVPGQGQPAGVRARAHRTAAHPTPLPRRQAADVSAVLPVPTDAAIENAADTGVCAKAFGTQ